MKRYLTTVCVGLAMWAGAVSVAGAQQANDFVGFLKLNDEDSVVQLKRCRTSRLSRTADGLCGTIVYDAALGDPNRPNPLDCNRRVLQLRKFENGIWTDGWALDTRTNRAYEVNLRMMPDGRGVIARSYIGQTTQGKDEVFWFVKTVPHGCEGKRPESLRRR